LLEISYFSHRHLKHAFPAPLDVGVVAMLMDVRGAQLLIVALILGTTCTNSKMTWCIHKLIP
jgi:hypothetical protein